MFCFISLLREIKIFLTSASASGNREFRKLKKYLKYINIKIYTYKK